MKVHVKRLRPNCDCLKDGQVSATEPTEGYLQLYGVGSTLQISLTNGDARQQPLLPDLYDARLVCSHVASKKRWTGLLNIPAMLSDVNSNSNSRANNCGSSICRRRLTLMQP